MLQYHLISLGCDMNHSDAERISAVLDDIGFEEVASEEDANLVIAVACSVRQTAIDKIHGFIHRWKKRQSCLSKTNDQEKKFVTVLTGCILPKDKEVFQKQFDIMFDIKELPFFPEKLSLFFPEIKSKPMAIAEYLNITPKYKDPFRTYIPISTGCNQFCTYCAVPYTRGREISRPMEEIISEVQKRVEAGSKIITLLGQNVNSYGLDWERQKKYSSGIQNHFVELLQRVDEISGDFWVYFYSNHPKDVNEELLEVVKNGKRLCKYLHLPFQAGNNEILQKMNRRYTKEEYLALVEKVYITIPEITLTTDIIVGFPGETREQFYETMEICEYARYDMAFVAKYSPRPGSWAMRNFADDVSWKEKKFREREVTNVIEKHVAEKNQKLFGKELRVFVDTIDIAKKKIIGRTDGNKKMLFPFAENVPFSRGQFITATVQKTFAWALEGNFISFCNSSLHTYDFERSRY